MQLGLQIEYSRIINTNFHCLHQQCKHFSYPWMSRPISRSVFKQQHTIEVREIIQLPYQWGLAANHTISTTVLELGYVGKLIGVYFYSGPALCPIHLVLIYYYNCLVLWCIC